MRLQARSRRAVGLVIAAGLLMAGSAAAGDFDVNTVLDEVDDNPGNGVCHTAGGNCSLRAAVMEANQLGSSSVSIELPAGVFVLTLPPAGGNGDESGDLNLTAGTPTIVLFGAGASRTIIDGNQLDRVFSVDSGRVVQISHVTIRNGKRLTGFGGGIQNQGSLYVYRSVISGNSGSAGGAGIHNSGTMELLESTLSGNLDAGYGGGLHHVAIAPAGASSVTRCAISGNSAYLAGGGIYTGPGAVDLFVANSTISGNSSVTDGGGIYSSGTTWTYNATIAFNQADSDADEDGGSGGGVYNAGFFYPRNTVIAGNTHAGTPDLDDCTGTIGVFGHGWFSSLSGCTPVQGVGTAEWDLIGSLAEFGLLQYNGGPTRTHALQAGSTLINSGFACNGTGAPSVDQRGGLRSPEGTCDAGAFEYGALPAGLIFADGFEAEDLRAWD